jgi:CTP:molybdopterin cytidylyltransferase MocA
VSGVAGVLLAAGAGERFGGEVPKPLVNFRGRPLLAWPLGVLRDGGVDPVLVVVGAHGDVVAAAVGELGGADVVRCAGWGEGLSASLRAGVAAASARGAEAVVVALADQPLLDGRAVARVIAARAPGEADAIRATYDGTPGHPTLLEASTFAAIAALRGDAGARELLRDPAVHVRRVGCDGLGCPDDADTPQALGRLEAWS